MIVADVCEFYSEKGGGVRTYIQQKLDASARAGITTLILAPGAEDRIELRPGGKVIWIRSPVLPVDPRYHIFWDHKPVFEVLDRFSPHVVEGSSAWRGGWIAARWPGRAVKSFFIHQDPVAVYPQTLLGNVMSPGQIDRMFEWFWAYMRKLSGHFDLSVVSGAWLADRLESFGLRRPLVVPFGVEKEAFSAELRDPLLRREMLAACGITHPEARLLVAVSRHHPEKRLGALFRAVEQVGREVPLGLYVIGDGPMRKWVDRKGAATHGVFIAGPVWDRTELARRMASADAMLHGGAAETFGLVLAEALCAGLPLIVPNAGGALDLADPACSEIYEVGDRDACAAAIRRFLARDRDAMSRAALHVVQNRLRRPEDHFVDLFRAYARRSGRAPAGLAGFAAAEAAGYAPA